MHKQDGAGERERRLTRNSISNKVTTLNLPKHFHQLDTKYSNREHSHSNYSNSNHLTAYKFLRGTLGSGSFVCYSMALGGNVYHSTRIAAF